MQSIRVVVEPHASEDVQRIVWDGLNRYNVAMTGLTEYHPVVVLLRDADDEVVGGALGNIWGGWLHVRALWVAEPLRHQGHGKALLARAEQFARERGCRGVHLDTFSFQAPAFYQKLGYEVFATLEDFPAGHTQYFLRKRLADDT